MDTVVNKLLDVDREARQMLDEAKQYAERTAKEVEEEKAKIRAEYTEKADRHVRDLEAEQAGEVEEVQQQEEERMERLLAAMETHYRENRASWVEALCRQCQG